MLEETVPTLLVLFAAFADAKNLSICFPVRLDRNQQRAIADLAGLAAFEHDGVAVHIGMLARVPHSALVMSSTRHTDRYISIRASYRPISHVDRTAQ
jgi:hypothetical protein